MNPDLLGFLVAAVDACEKLLFDLVAKLEADRVVVVVLVTDVARVGPGEVGAGGRWRVRVTVVATVVTRGVVGRGRPVVVIEAGVAVAVGT